MRIAFLHRQLRGGGTEADLRRMATGLAERGHELHLVCARADAEVPGAVVHRVPIVRAGRVARLLSFAALAPRRAAQLSCDVVVGFGRTLRQDVVRVGGGTHASYLAQMEAASLRGAGRGPYHRAILWLERRQFAPGAYRRVIAVSARAAAEVSRDYGVPGAQVRVLYNGVDLERFTPTARATVGAALRAELGVGERPVCLALGTGFVRKGFDRLCDLWEAEAPEDAVLVLVGDDERLARFRRRADASHGRIRVVGPQPDPERWLAASDVLLAPSRQEAFGNVVLEACAAGVPVVTSTRSGVAELLGEPLRELVVSDPEDLATLRGAVRRALAERPRYARAARAFAEDRPWSRHLDELDTLLREVARGE